MHDAFDPNGAQPAADRVSGDAIGADASARPARDPRRRSGRVRALVTASVMCLGVAVGGIVVVASAPAPVGGQAARAASGATTTRLSDAQVNAMVMPITDADVRNTLRLDTFEGGVRARALDSCMATKGVASDLAATVQPMPADADIRLYEDPAALRQNGFGIVDNVRTTPIATAPVPTGAARWRRSAPRRRCRRWRASTTWSATCARRGSRR